MNLTTKVQAQGLTSSVGRKRRAIGRAIVVAILVVVIVIAAVGGLAASNYLSGKSSTTTSSVVSTSTTSTPSTASTSTISSTFSSSSVSSSTNSPSSSSSSTTSSESTTSQSSSVTSTSSSNRNSLVIDAFGWPTGDLNQLNGGSCCPWPNTLQYTVYQSLILANGSGLYNSGVIQYTPGLAQNWTVSGNGTIYTFNLRQNIDFSDGNPFNAYQVWMEEYGFYFLTANSSCWWENYCIFNMTNVDFGQQTIQLINQSGLINPSTQALAIMMNSSWPIYVTNPYQIVFHLQSPFLWLMGTMLTFAGLMFDSQYVLDHGGFGTGSPPTMNSNFAQNPIPGTGPYVVTQVVYGSSVVFTQNPTYWGDSLTSAQIAQQPYLDPGHAKTVTINFKSDDVARYTDLTTGASQISDIGFSDWNLVVNNSQYSYDTNPSDGAAWVGFDMNTNLYPTNITLVRQAIVHSINWTELANTAYGGKITPFVGPEYPLWKQFYDLGNFTPYSYNMTLAKQDLASANITNMPTFTMRIITGCDICINGAQVVQSDLANLGITVNIEVVTNGEWYTPYGSYSTNVANAQQIGQLAMNNGGTTYTPFALTPADYWVTFVSNTSVFGNYAGYYNPVVQKCASAFTSSNNVSYIQSLCAPAQAQIYKDAPYYWAGIDNLWVPSGGSTVWSNKVVSGFLLDPTFGGQSTVPIFNTVTFA
jgi:peptide/nickel transport system substrate-binding protein